MLVSAVKKHIEVKIVIVAIFVLASAQNAFTQQKTLDHSDFAIWNRIQNKQVSTDGMWIAYQLTPGEGDPTVHLYNVSNNTTASFQRATSPKITHDAGYAIFTISAPEDSVKQLRREKVKKEDLPLDTLAICDLRTNQVHKIPNIKSIEVPVKWGGYVVYTVDLKVPKKENEPETEEPENDEPKDKKSKTKKYSKKNGYPLIVRELSTGKEDTLDYVSDFKLARIGVSVAAITNGRDSTLDAGVYVFNGSNLSWQPIKLESGKYKKLSLSEGGNDLAFVGDVDTSDAQIRPYNLYWWKNGRDSAEVFATNNDAFIPEGWIISEHANMRFSKIAKRLHFGLAPEPILQDTNLLEEEIVNVEVWHYNDPLLYTQQSVRAEREKKRSFLAVANLKTGEKHLVANLETPNSYTDIDAMGPWVLLSNDEPYLKESSWTGMRLTNVSIYNLNTQAKRLVGTAIDARPSISPAFEYLYWYSRLDSLWHIESSGGGGQGTTSESIPTQMYDELNDVPNNPYSYGSAGWTKGDAHFLVYDRYDIWSMSPKGHEPINLTNGRESNLQYRYIKLDPDARFINTSKPILLRVFNEETKESGYALLDLITGELNQLVYGKSSYTSRPLKPVGSDEILFTRESFTEFPNLHLTRDWFKTSVQISDANPQQKDYKWGDAELYNWTAYDGKELTGILVKPDNFDPNKKYPMIVNFYSRSSNNVYRHRAPYPHRSTINYSFYVSRGYVIFNPDVEYEIGHPGASAYNCVVSGTQAVIDEGFIDADRVGVQGHSWGGYQIADLITRTDIFACAESGAPVVNMISAYGGIRWQTGLSRMFQYEHTQSRLGGTLWDSKDLYLENSPIFNLDKVTTPVLIMHNDHDGHVPWYQGIEFFVAMRRLGKPAWMLNYNDEPHWPLKLQNRKDFNIRMQQFFDHYLMAKPAADWIKEGVPAVHKGILQGYEIEERN